MTSTAEKDAREIYFRGTSKTLWNLRLVDNSQDDKTSDCAGILRGLSLSVVEVRRNGDNSVGNLLTKVSLGCFLRRHTINYDQKRRGR